MMHIKYLLELDAYLQFCLADSLPYSGYDGARLLPHWRDLTIFHGFHWITQVCVNNLLKDIYYSKFLWYIVVSCLHCYWQPGPEDCGHLPFVLWTVVLPAPLWLWYASCEVCADSSRESEAKVSQGEWERTVAQGIDGCQHGQISCTGCATVSGVTFYTNYICQLKNYWFKINYPDVAHRVSSLIYFLEWSFQSQTMMSSSKLSVTTLLNSTSGLFLGLLVKLSRYQKKVLLCNA